MKNILITGAASGLGRHLTLTFSKEGYQVYAIDINQNALNELPSQNIIPLCVDITNSEEWNQKIIPLLNSSSNSLDIVIACASIMHIGNVEDCTLNNWNRVCNINLTAQFLTAQKTIKYLKKAKGNILFIGSPSSKFATHNEVCYITFKHALCGLSKSIAFDFGKYGIRSNVIHPGWMRTAMSDKEMEEIMENQHVSLEDAYAIATRLVPLKRPASLDEVTSSIKYITSEQASYITGAELLVDGGLSIVDPGMASFM